MKRGEVMPRGRQREEQLMPEALLETAPVSVFDQLIIALVSNPEVYKGTANDAAKVIKLAEQILGQLTKGGTP